MNKRIYLSLKRKKSNFLLFFVFLALISLFLSGFLIEQVARWNIIEIEKTYGNSFTIRIIRDQMNGDLWAERVATSATGEMSTQIYIGPNVSYEMLELISKVDGIKAYEAGRECEILLLDYSIIPGQWNESYKLNLENPEKSYFPIEYTKNLIYATKEYTTYDSTYFEKFYDGSFVLVDGRHIQPKDDHVAIISQKLANRNQLKIGDMLKIDVSSLNIRGYPVESIGSIEVEIIGLFDTTYEQATFKFTDESDILKNWVLIDTQAGSELDELLGYKDMLGHGTFFVENPSKLDEVMKQVKDLDWIDWSYYTLEKNDTLYSNAVAPLRTIRIIMAIGLGIVAVSGIVLLILLITYTVKKRTHEVGILMALGVSGKEIRYQIIAEHLMIGLSAYILALGISSATAPLIGNQLLENLNGTSEQKIYTEEEIEAAIARGDYSGNYGAVSEDANNQRTGVPAPESLEIRMNIWVALLVGVMEVFMILFVVDHSIKKTLKLEPIRVLSMIR